MRGTRVGDVEGRSYDNGGLGAIGKNISDGRGSEGKGTAKESRVVRVCGEGIVGKGTSRPLTVIWDSIHRSTLIGLNNKELR